MGVLGGCKPRPEVLKGDLDDAIFAADFGSLIAGTAPKVYSDPATFFQNTHPARPLCKIVQAVFGRLADPKEGGATIRLSTGFGGGKTHTLMALWHLGTNISDPSVGTELLPAAGRPKKVYLVAVDVGKAGVASFATHDSIETKSLWGELFYCLGGKEALKALGKGDDPEGSPAEALIDKVFPKGPVLILLDELVIYMSTLSERGQKNLLAFVNRLTAVVSKRPQTVLIVTDPGSQATYAKEAAELQKALLAAEELNEVLGRKVSDFDPIGDESAQVIVRRLLESVDPTAAQAASAMYHTRYNGVLQDTPGLLPPAAATAAYAQEMVQSYPFHPRLLETARDRLGALQDFQKSRGVLRLFARILRDAWEAAEDHELISAGEIDWSSPRIQADLLQRLNRDSFKSAVSADIEKHAWELDSGAPGRIHVRVASALLLESLPLQPSSGLDPNELTLAVLRPDEAGPEPSEALDRLVGVCWHTYPMPGGRGWQFRYEANIIKQIEERKGQIPVEDARSRVLSEAQGYFSGPTFKLKPWPDRAGQVPESAELQLVLCEDEKIARLVCAYSDDSNPQAPTPRGFRNAIVGVTATPSALSGAIDRALGLLAAEAIEREHRTGEAGKIVREQLQRIKPDLVKQFRIQTCRAFDRVVLAGGGVYPLDEQFQVPEEQILQRAQGQACLKKFLDSKGLLYQPGDHLDANLFLKDVLPGAVPHPDMPGVYTAKAVHERFLAAPRLRLLPDGAVVRQTLLKSVEDGRVVIRLSDGRAFDSKGYVEGPEDGRRRKEQALSSISLDDSTYVTPSDSNFGVLWVKEGLGGYEKSDEKKPLPPPEAEQAVATTWSRAVELAAARPLLELRLLTSSPASAANLLSLAGPLGPETVTTSVSVGGNAKDGGTINFAASRLKPTHPSRPLTVAQTIFNSLEAGSGYEAELMMKFGASGRSGLQAQLQVLAENAPADLSLRALFGKPLQGKR